MTSDDVTLFTQLNAPGLFSYCHLPTVPPELRYSLSRFPQSSGTFSYWFPCLSWSRGVSVEIPFLTVLPRYTPWNLKVDLISLYRRPSLRAHPTFPVSSDSLIKPISRSGWRGLRSHEYYWISHRTATRQPPQPGPKQCGLHGDIGHHGAQWSTGAAAEF